MTTSSVPSTQDRLHVVLGTGALAGATAEALLSKGLQVRMISRSGRMTSPIDGVEVRRCDITDRAALTPHLKAADAVYFCAQPPYHQWPEHFPALQAVAIAAASDVGARLVVAENLYGYGPVAGPMREDMPLAPNTVKGRVRAEMHRALMAANAAGRIEVAVARGSDFFGPRVEGSVVGSRAMQALRLGKTVEIAGDPDLAHSYTFVRDFGAALAVLGTRKEAVGGVWHVPNAPAVSTRRFFEIAARLAGRTVRLRRMRRLEMRLLGLFIPPVRETIEMLYEFEAPFLVDDGKFKAAFGDLSTPLEAALAETLTLKHDDASATRRA